MFLRISNSCLQSFGQKRTIWEIKMPNGDYSYAFSTLVYFDCAAKISFSQTRCDGPSLWNYIPIWHSPQHRRKLNTDNNNLLGSKIRELFISILWGPKLITAIYCAFNIDQKKQFPLLLNFVSSLKCFQANYKWVSIEDKLELANQLYIIHPKSTSITLFPMLLDLQYLKYKSFNMSQKYGWNWILKVQTVYMLTLRSWHF